MIHAPPVQNGDQQIDRPFEQALENLLPGPMGHGCKLDLRIAVAVDETVDMLEQVGPDGLRAGYSRTTPDRPQR